MADEVGEYEVALNLLLDNWVKASAPLTIIVKEAQQ